MAVGFDLQKETTMTMAGFDLQKETTMTMAKAQTAFNDLHHDLSADLYTQFNNSTEKDKAVEALVDDPSEVEKKVIEAFNDDHSELAENIYTQSKAPKYAVLFEEQSQAHDGLKSLNHSIAPIGSSNITQTRGDTFGLATKEKEGGVLEIAKKVAVVAGVAVVGWGIYKLLGNEGLSGISKLLGGDADSERQRKTMKAPERAYRMFRDDFERDPKSYFKELRNSKKGRKPF